MSYQIYPWNPFGNNPDAKVINELVTVSGENRDVFVPRYAPFFSKGLVLKDVQSGITLKPGKDFVYGVPFGDFITKKSRTVYGSIVLLPSGQNRQLILEEYFTLGEPFTQDDNDFLELMGNVVHSPRTIDWSQVVNLPQEGFPEDPHEHKPELTYNYQSLIDVLTAIDETTRDEFNNPTVASELIEHLNSSFKLAHPNASAADFNLENVPNYRAAEDEDLSGNSDQLLVTIEKARKLFEQLLRDLGMYPDQTPTPPGEDEDQEYLTLQQAIELFYAKQSLLSEIREMGRSAQASARNNLGLKQAAVADILQETGTSETDTMSQAAISRLLGDLTFNTISWTYVAEGGELSLTPPHPFLNCIVVIDGLFQPTGYAFTAEDGTVTFAGSLEEGDIVEIIMDAPTVRSWLYTADGGETVLEPPYELNNVMLCLNGFGQPLRQSFTYDETKIYLGSPAIEGDLFEVLMDVPLTSQNALSVNRKIEKLQEQVEALMEQLQNQTGMGFVSKASDVVLYGDDEQLITLKSEDLQYIESIDVDVDEEKP